MNRRDILKIPVAAGLGLAAPWTRAQTGDTWPNKPVRVIVPYSPGGSTDITARIAATYMTRDFGQPFVVENHPGGGGNVGMAALQRSQPDGYTIGLMTVAQTINATLFENPGYDVRAGIQPVGILYSGPLVLVANPSVPFDSVNSMIVYARQYPERIHYASTGIGGSPHLAAELFNLKVGTRMTHTPYKGSAPAVADVISGKCQIMFDTTVSALPHVLAGKLNALGVSSLQRAEQLPDVPTLVEAGIPDYEVASWNGLCVPAATPIDIVEKLNASLIKAMRQPEVNNRMHSLGSSVAPLTTRQFQAFVLAETDKWAEVIKSAKLGRI